MRRIASSLLLLGIATPLAGQDTPPSNLEALELERSTHCVDVLSRLEELDAELAPHAARAQRLLAIAGAIRIEEASIVDSLDTSDPLEAAVRDWFQADAALAQRYLTEQDQAILDERAAARSEIQETVGQAIEAVQAEADSVVGPSNALPEEAVGCSGAILIRPAAVEACAGVTSRVCDAARDSTVDSPFRFVDSSEFLWFREEFRPWTVPGPIQISAQGQLGGATTTGSTRVGNVVINVSLTPLLQARSELSPEQAAMIDSVNAPLGIEVSHPTVTFVPALIIQAALPAALDQENRYVVHFGTPSEPDIIWAADADTGAPIGGSVALAPAHVARLTNGDPLTLSAVRGLEGDEIEALYSIQLSPVNQVPRTQALLGYMRQQLDADLQRLLPPESADTTAAPGVR